MEDSAMDPKNSDEKNIDANANFNDFAYQFGFNSDFQKSRIKFPLEYDNLGNITSVKENKWNPDRLYSNQEAFTEIGNGLNKKEKSNERVFSWIKLKTGISKNYYFKKENDHWFLTKIDVKKEPVAADKENFYMFLSKFCSDSVFQKKHIKFPVDMTFLDEDFNEINEEGNAEDWSYTNFNYNSDSISTMYYDFNRTFENTDTRTLEINGVENGINVQLTFKKVRNKWLLIRFEDYST
jgi:hypothetical protein